MIACDGGTWPETACRVPSVAGVARARVMTSMVDAVLGDFCRDVQYEAAGLATAIQWFIQRPSLLDDAV